jgi:hypothetical protein
MNGLNTSFNIPVPDFGTAMAAGKGFNASRFLGGGGASTGMDPFTIAMAGIGGAAQLFGGIRSSNAMSDAAYNQAQATKYSADRAAQAGIDVAKGNLAQAMFGANFASQEKDLDFFRQRAAAFDKFGPLGDARRESQRRDMESQFGFYERGDVKAARQRRNKEAMKQEIVRQNAKMAGMFGPIAPISVRSMAV